MTRVKETFDAWSSLCYHHCQRTWVEYNGYNDSILKVHHLSYSTLTPHTHWWESHPCAIFKHNVSYVSVSTFKHCNTNILLTKTHTQIKHTKLHNHPGGWFSARVLLEFYIAASQMDFYFTWYFPGILAPFWWFYAWNCVSTGGEKTVQIFHVNYRGVCSKKPFESLHREPLSGMKLAVSWVWTENMSSGI